MQQQTFPTTRALRRVVLSVLAALALIPLLAGPASAHTSLVDSDPDSRSVFSQPPDTLALTFATPVEPERVTLTVIDAAGRRWEGARRLTPVGTAVTVVEFALPDMPDGLYGLGWQSIGSDGHRVSGEVVLGLGTGTSLEGAPNRFTSLSAADRLLDGAAAVGRFLWYAALSLVVGAGVMLRWLARRGRTPVIRLFGVTTGRWLRFGVGLGVIAALARAAVTATVIARGSAGDPAPIVAQAWTAATTTSPLLWLVAAVVLAGLRTPAGRLAGGEGVSADAGRSLWVVAGMGVGVAALLGVAAGHASTRADPLTAVTLGWVHLLAAAAWVGPLAVVSLVVATPGVRRLDVDERRDAVAGFFRAYATVAMWSFAILLATGVPMARSTVGDRLFENGYGAVLLVKVALIAAVVVPLGAYHDRHVRRGLSDRLGGVGGPRFMRTVRVEAAGLAVVLGIASVLTGLNPEAGTPPSAGELVVQEAGEGVDVLGGEVVEDVSQCAELVVGKPDCYRAYFADLMRREGADVAVAEVERLYATHEYIRADCHQITHDLGEDAADYYDTLAEAFSFEASACWSGYYHGVVETRLASYDDDELRAAVPDICAGAAEGQEYSFAHYNCVHGLGHGLMLRSDNDLFGSLYNCEAYRDEWERVSCVGGAFMENIVAAQQDGVDSAELRADDLRYPCNAVDEAYRGGCWLMQTSYILWQLDYDYVAAFGVCDELESSYVRTCYQSMGRDISGNALLDPDTVIANCRLGSAANVQWCYVGAALNAVYNDHDTTMATRLCEAIEEQYQAECFAARDRAASSF